MIQMGKLIYFVDSGIITSPAVYDRVTSLARTLLTLPTCFHKFDEHESKLVPPLVSKLLSLYWDQDDCATFKPISAINEAS